jgi:adenosylcobinamide-GDP ribazoletransferase
MLEIMRDPRLGAHGASALVLLLAAKQSALSGMPPHALALALVGAPAMARTAAVWLLAMFPSARAEGLGASFTSHVRLRHAAAASLLGWGGCAAFGLPALVPLVASTLAALLMGVWARTRLGGINGDVCGAAIEVGELACWIAIRSAA